MININSIDSSINHLNNLLNKDYVNTTDLNTTDYLKDNYFIHLGYYNEKELFEELIHKYYTKNEDLFVYNDIDQHVINHNISYYNKFFIDNPHNDFFLKDVKISDNVDLTKKNICDLNISKILNKNYNFYLFKLEFIRNLYYYISTKKYIDNYEFSNNVYYFEIPTKYFISDRKNILKNNYNNFVKFKVKVFIDKFSITFENNLNITDNLIETIKPILNYHINLITKDNLLKLGILNKYDIIHKYAEEIANKYDNIRFDSNIKILDYLHYKYHNIYTENFLKNYFNIIKSNYESFNSISKNNTKIYDIQNNNDNNDNNDNNIIVTDPNEKFDEEIKIEEEIKINNNNFIDNDIIDKNIINDNKNDILFDDINENNKKLENEKKINFYKNIIISFIIFLSIISLFIITYLIIKIVSNNYNIIDILLSFVIIILILFIIMLIFIYSSDDYLKKLFFLNNEHFKDWKPNEENLRAIFDMFDKEVSNIPPTENIELIDTDTIETDTTIHNDEDYINNEINLDLQENLENLKIIDNDNADTSEKIIDLEIDSEEYKNKIEYEKMKFENLEANNKDYNDELKNKELFSLNNEDIITNSKLYIEQKKDEKEVTMEKFINYIKNSNILEEQYIKTVNDIKGKLNVANLLNEYNFLGFDNTLDTINYQFGSEFDNTVNNENNEVIDDKYTSYNEEEIKSYNYITDINDLHDIIKGYKLDKYITIKDNLLDVNIDIEILNKQTLDEIRNADLAHDMDYIREKLETTKKLIELTKMIAAINMNKKINIQLEIENEEDKLNNAISDYKNNYNDIVELKNNINSENEIKNKIKTDIDLYEKTIENIGKDLLKLSKRLQDNEKKKNDYVKYYDYTLDKLKQININKIEKDLLQIEKIKNIELYEINNLEILDSKIATQLINNKYKIIDDNKELFKIREYQLEIDNKYKNIESNYEKQIEFFTKLQKENVKDELFAMKIESKKVTIETSHKMNNEHNLKNNNDKNNFNEILEKDIVIQTNTKRQLLKIKNDLEIENQEKRKILINIEGLNSKGIKSNDPIYKELSFKLEKKNLEIFYFTKEFNELNLRKQQIDEKIINNKIEIEKIKFRNDKSKKLYKQIINNNKNEYELLLVQENFNLRKRNLLLIEVSKVIKNIHTDKENIIFIMSKKIELIKKYNDDFKNNYDIMFADKNILENEKKINNKKLEDILEKSCLLFNKVDNNIKIECSKNNIKEINLKINELLESNLIKDQILKNKLITIKSNNTLLHEKAVYISLLLFKYDLDINTNIIKNITKDININDMEIDLNNAKIDKLEFTILYKNVYKKTLENEKNRKVKVIKQYSDKKLEYKMKYQNLKNTIENYSIKKKLENEIDILVKNIEYNTNKKDDFDKYIEQTSKELIKLNKYFLKVKDELNYETKKLVDKKFQKIVLLTSNFSEYYTLISNFVELKNKFNTLNLSKYIFIPIILSDSNKKQIYDIFNDNDKEFKKYISNDSRYENLKKMVDNITNIIVIDKDQNIKIAKVVIKFDINYDIFLDKTYNVDNFKYDITNTLSSALIIDKKYINIISITNNDNILLNVNIETNQKFTSQQEIVDFLKIQVSNKDSELKKNKYGINIIEIISNIKEIEKLILSKTELCDGNIITPRGISDKEIGGDYFDDIFNYCTNIEQQKGVLLLHLPLITKEIALDTTLLDYSISQRIVYEALCDNASIRNIYYNYIELDKTLLKIDNINLIDRKEYSISFISKLQKTNDNKQHILLSNGQIYQTFNLTLNNDNLNKINWELYHNDEKKTIYNNNILTIGFINNYLYINIPCSNNTDYEIISNDSTNLYAEPDQWFHWIITKKNNNICIYKNLVRVFKTDILENTVLDETTCYTNNTRYDKKTLYIGGIKTDLDSNTKMLNDLVCYKGGLKDLRIYEVELTENDIASIFINNCETGEKNKNFIDAIFTNSPEFDHDNGYIENTENAYTGEKTTDTENTQGSEISSTETGMTYTEYDTSSFTECNNKNGTFTYIETEIESEIESEIEYSGKFSCITDNYPCLNNDDISYYDIDKKKKCINKKNINNSTEYNFINTKNSDLFEKMNNNFRDNNDDGTIMNNFNCSPLQKLIYKLSDYENAEKNEGNWECDNTNHQCHDDSYTNQLPMKNKNGQYDCISKNNTGEYIDDVVMYNLLKTKKIESTFD